MRYYPDNDHPKGMPADDFLKHLKEDLVCETGSLIERIFKDRCLGLIEERDTYKIKLDQVVQSLAEALDGEDVAAAEFAQKVLVEAQLGRADVDDLYEKLITPIGSLGFSTRSSNVFRRAGISLVYDLVSRERGQLAGLRDLGPHSLFGITEVLEPRGLGLGMFIPAQVERRVLAYRESLGNRAGK